jgi:hypothetical protein
MVLFTSRGRARSLRAKLAMKRRGFASRTWGGPVWLNFGRVTRPTPPPWSFLPDEVQKPASDRLIVACKPLGRA